MPRPRLKYFVKLANERAEGSTDLRVDLDVLEGGTGKFNAGFEPTRRPADGCVRFGSGDVLFGKLRPY